MRKQKRKVVVAMSGGVDSSVAALLLKKQGYGVTGVFMRCYNLDGCAEQDAEDARRVAEKIGIPFYVWDFEEEYKKRVVRYMVDGYRRGLTPNPDVMCNKEIKFGLFFEKARKLGADYIATGHYVRLQRGRLFTARDKNKDQSYFLWTLTQKQLEHCLFPIGEHLKPKVREIARNAGLPTAEKKDSQGICFLGQVTLQDFLKEYIPEKPGLVLSVAGQEVGAHAGAQFYTIGQRHIGVSNAGAAKPFYVAEKNIRKNTLTVAEGNDHPSLYKKEVELEEFNFPGRKHSDILKNVRMSVYARVRYRQPLAEAELRTRTPKKNIKLIFKKPQKFVAAGQSAVFYSKQGEMLGGGIIL